MQQMAENLGLLNPFLVTSLSGSSGSFSPQSQISHQAALLQAAATSPAQLTGLPILPAITTTADTNIHTADTMTHLPPHSFQPLPYPALSYAAPSLLAGHQADSPPACPVSQLSQLSQLQQLQQLQTLQPSLPSLTFSPSLPLLFREGESPGQTQNL